MLMMLALPILIIFCLGVFASYGIIVALSIGFKIVVYALFILIFSAITIGLTWVIVILYKGWKTKIGKVSFVLFITFCLGILLNFVLSKITTTNVTVVNETKDEIITEIHMIPIDSRANRKETKVYDNDDFGYKIRFTEEMTERCKKFGLNYKKGQEWFYLKGNEKDLVCGLWKSESYTFRVPKGTWIIALKTINSDKRIFYSVIYNQNVFCTHIGENLTFTYFEEEISLSERQKAKFMPEVIDKHLKKEVYKKFEPNLIVKTKSVSNVNSGLFIRDKSKVTTFPEIKIGNYVFYSLVPDNTYTVNYYFTEWHGYERKEVLNEDIEITINNDGMVLYLDQEKKTIKQLQSSGNYVKCKIDN